MMCDELALPRLIKYLEQAFEQFPDPRTGKNTRYDMRDAGLGACAVFFIQSPSFIEGTDSAPIFNDDLAARIGFVRKRFPHEDRVRHKWAMNALDVASKHAAFRNIVAHSPLAITGHADGSYRIQGIMNITPKSSSAIAQLISLEELTGRVNESAVVARQLLEMQADFPVATGG